METQDLNYLKSLIRDVPNFPKPGIIFKDIGPLLQNRFSETIEVMSNQVDWNSIDSVMGIESRGFIFASALAQRNKKGFIPVRKKGKLPPPVIQEFYSLEYGQDCLELGHHSKDPSIIQEKNKILLVDDVLATGGTVKAAINLCEKANIEVVGVMFLINLKSLNTMPSAFAAKGIHFYSLIDY
ncbi:MAG: adenine phosphoribosyltransferase [Bacteriovoracaceae bacterium]|nr:adenine phosphoribosyltransferase [Bacteriovoracaceae bacterium]